MRWRVNSNKVCDVMLNCASEVFHTFLLLFVVLLFLVVTLQNLAIQRLRADELPPLQVRKKHR